MLDIIIMFYVLYDWPVSREINEGYSKLSKWLQVDGGSPLGINFGRKRGFLFVCLPLNQDYACPSSPLAKMGMHWSLFLPL